MLRITTHNDSNFFTFKVEGRLAGPWVKELRDCWQNMLADHRFPAIRVDLREVTFVDISGKELLGTLYRQGAQFIATGCLMKALVAEITHSPTT